MINFDCLEKGLVIVSSPHFVYDFSRKCFSCYIVLTDQISLPDYLYFLRYWSVFVKTLVLELILVKTPVLEYFLIKLQAWGPASLIKRDSSSVFSCEICEILRTPFFTERVQRLLLMYFARGENCRLPCVSRI